MCSLFASNSLSYPFLTHFLMEEEATTANSETEIKMLQDCTGAIASINTHLKTVLGNLDQLSDSIQQLMLLYRT